MREKLLNTRKTAWQMLKEDTWKPFLAVVIYTLISSFVSTFSSVYLPGLSFAVLGLVVGPLTIGIVIYFLEYIEKRNSSVDRIFDGYKYFERALTLYFIKLIFISLWTCLFIIPGIIAAIRYSQAEFILAENPEMTAMEAIDKSKKIMDKRILEFAYLNLVFIALEVLAVLPMIIGIFVSILVTGVTSSVLNSVSGVMLAIAVMPLCILLGGICVILSLGLVSVVETYRWITITLYYKEISKDLEVQGEAEILEGYKANNIEDKFGLEDEDTNIVNVDFQEVDE